MSLPLHTLKHEHRIIEKALRGLSGICVRLETGEEVPAEVISDILDFIGGFADRYHHGKEEKYLFPVLQQGKVFNDELFDALNQEHEVERILTAEMDSFLRQVKAGQDLDVQLLAKAALRYIDHLTRHIRHEDSILFRLADELLDESEKENLSENFRNAAIELGLGEIERYEQVAAHLERDWA
jgi:hemerythrin-like domain-containing protein